MSDTYRYHVTWEDLKTGVTKFGIFEEHADEAPAAKARGNCIVSDAVLPARYELPLAIVRDVPKSTDRKRPFDDELDRHVEAEFKRAQELSDALKGCVPGKLVSFGVADGSAWYVITKVTKTKVTVEWRGFCPDRWTDRYLGYGRTCDRAYVEPAVRAAEFQGAFVPAPIDFSKTVQKKRRTA